MERDLRAVLEGAREGGATEFYVCDAHEMGRNLSLDHLGEDVIVVRGTGHALSMMAGVDRAEFDGAFFVAYHGKNGSQGVMAHTYYPGVVERVLVAGHEVGELGMNIPVAWAFGIPALLATGDDVLLEEARKVAPRIERCLVCLLYTSPWYRIRSPGSVVIRSSFSGRVVPRVPTFSMLL